MKTALLLLLTTAITTGCTRSPLNTDERAAQTASNSTLVVIPADDVEWGYLNPARGDKSPGAGALWGDRTRPGAAGFLVRFDEGFSSPPHIHNVSYRGVVIEGLVHNDDPGAASMWMPAGSYWTQPRGESHITAAEGRVNIAYIEIEDGPYLVLPVDKAFDSGERPVNIDASNMVWLDASSARDRAQIAHLWGDPDGSSLSGSLVKLPAGFKGAIRASGGSFRAVVVRGEPVLEHHGRTTLAEGSYFGSEANSAHLIPLRADAESVLYIRTAGAFEIVPTPAD